MNEFGTQDLEQRQALGGHRKRAYSGLPAQEERMYCCTAPLCPSRDGISRPNGRAFVHVFI